MVSFTTDQRFIVTGASSGIGEGVALQLNELGATVIGIGRNQERLEGMKAKAKYPENVFLEQKDLAADIAVLPSYIKTLKDRYGKLQGLACCAGISKITPLRALELADVREMFDINFFVPLFMVKGFADRRVNNGAGSSVVCIASIGAVHCDPGMASYDGSKGALISSMRAIAREVAPQGIRVNCVSPSLIETSMIDDVSRRYAEGKYPMGLGSVPDAANLIVYLLASESKWITAQNYIVDCGAF